MDPRGVPGLDLFRGDGQRISGASTPEGDARRSLASGSDPVSGTRSAGAGARREWGQPVECPQCPFWLFVEPLGSLEASHTPTAPRCGLPESARAPARGRRGAIPAKRGNQSDDRDHVVAGKEGRGFGGPADVFPSVLVRERQPEATGGAAGVTGRRQFLRVLFNPWRRLSPSRTAREPPRLHQRLFQGPGHGRFSDPDNPSARPRRPSVSTDGRGSVLKMSASCQRMDNPWDARFTPAPRKRDTP